MSRGAAGRRTKLAILDAAAHLVARKANATMAEVADAAGVARSTVHRHFPERGDLVDALEDYANSELVSAHERSASAGGTALDALLRFGQELFEKSDLLVAAYGNPGRETEIADGQNADPALNALILKGQGDGSIARELPAAWVAQVLWSLFYAAWLMNASSRMSKHEALGMFLETFTRAVEPR
ncbi:TetR/AcrR family transcriptional regulator [Nitratireductor pacificus]|uniref:TetR family transcriptional regulator n=1 Tax=Nitratireductor pacificus pht-3B TaxID=391937 RepID=K2N7M0_9HYPH|nr:TetR/AcrR family transcriptional regulator [Nitratireductor pacificus]EKF20098.1 TetR family transcriptional regulator [Nitratireductor pacificus pht-3B]